MLVIMKVNCHDKGIKKAVEIIENGGVIIFPTDTVYGIGCNPYDTNAVKKIYEIKSREKIKSLPVLASSIQIVKQISIIDEFTEKIIKKYWPGPLTLILKLKDKNLKKSLNLEDKIAVRLVDGILYVRGTGGFSKEVPIEGANEMQIFDFKYRNGVLTLRIK